MSESPRKVQNVRQLTTKIRQEVFQKECFLLDLFTYVITSFDSLERMVTIMKRFYTAESVTEGHPDKLCDLIADSILDACLKEDENSKGGLRGAGDQREHHCGRRDYQPI